VPALIAVNVVMILFNLLPAFPMDGGRVLRGVLGFFMPFARATRIASVVGQGMALLFAAWGLGLFGNASSPMLLFIALFVFLAAGEERAVVETRMSLDGISVRDAMLTEFHVLTSGDSLQRAIELLIAGNQHDFPVVDDGEVIGVLTRADLARALQRQDTHRSVGEVVARDNTLAFADEPVEQAIRRMRDARRTAVPVVDGSRLVGLLTLENVGDLLLVQDALRRRKGVA
jgi:CBS domain-containing protein